MKLGGSILFWALLLAFSSTIVSASVYGNWDSSENSCKCDIFLNVEIYGDGSPTGTMSFGGAEVAMYKIVVDGDHLSFSVDQASTSSGRFVSYDCDVNVNGDNMIGRCTNEMVPSETLVFSAKRQKENR